MSSPPGDPTTIVLPSPLIVTDEPNRLLQQPVVSLEYSTAADGCHPAYGLVNT